MDDRNFDETSARQWMSLIESDGASIREKDIYPAINSWLAGGPDSSKSVKVLDIGCGQGACSERIKLEGADYTGLDASPILLDRAKFLHPGRNFVQGDVYAMPFGNGAFDAAFSITLWHLLADAKKASSEVSRVLKRGGRFLLITADPAFYSRWTESYAESRLEGIRFEGKLPLADGSRATDVLFLRPLCDILGALESAGLHVEKTEYFRQFVSIQGMEQAQRQ